MFGWIPVRIGSFKGKAVTAFWDGLDKPWIAEGAAELPDRMGHDMVGHERALPDLLDQLFFTDHFSAKRPEHEQKVHDPGLNVNRFAPTDNTIALWLDSARADVKGRRVLPLDSSLRIHDNLPDA